LEVSRLKNRVETLNQGKGGIIVVITDGPKGTRTTIQIGLKVFLTTQERNPG
jgi:lysophospholipid acyltransferase (LPLAT)-like uncharacterized protein